VPGLITLPAGRRRTLEALVTSMAVAAVLVVVPAGAALASPGAESAFVGRINGLRASRGLPSLQVHGELTGVARSWASHMADVGSISHNPSLASQVGGGWRKLGENVGTGGSVDSLHQAFVNSPGHYRNLVDPAYTHIGVGVVERNGVLWTAHVFMALAGAAPPRPAPPAPPAPSARPRAPAPAPGRSAAPAPRRPAGAPSAPTPTRAPAAPPPPAPPPPPPPEPTVLPSILIDLHQLDRRS
jgi:hypothetical protein